MDKHHVLISRHWHKPNIEVTVNDEKICVRIDLKDFVEGLVQEVGNPALLLTQESLRKKLLKSTETVLEKAKQSTSQVM